MKNNNEVKRLKEKLEWCHACISAQERRIRELEQEVRNLKAELERDLMAGTIEGGKKAAKTNRAKHGDDFYARIGRKGGKAGTTGGFAANRELASIAGKIGGKISKRGPAKK